MTKIAICNNSLEQIEIIKAACNRYFSANNRHPAHIVEFLNSNDCLDFVEKKGGFDIVFLDIILTGINGIELAKQLRLRDKNYQLIFITNTRDFAVEAIALKSTHYLLMPFSDGEFDEAMDRAYEYMDVRAEKKFSLKSRNGEYYKVYLSNVISIECYGHIQKLYCNTFYFEMRESWAYLNENVIDISFFLIRKGVIINMDNVTFIGKDFVKMCDGRTLPVAKRRMPNFKKLYLDYTVSK